MTQDADSRRASTVSALTAQFVEAALTNPSIDVTDARTRRLLPGYALELAEHTLDTMEHYHDATVGGTARSAN